MINKRTRKHILIKYMYISNNRVTDTDQLRYPFIDKYESQ
jgi:hypothetical protein